MGLYRDNGKENGNYREYIGSIYIYILKVYGLGRSHSLATLIAAGALSMLREVSFANHS